MNKGAEAFAKAIAGQTHEAIEELLGLAKRSGQVTRLARAERKPGRSLSFRIEQKLGVPMSWWEIPVSTRSRRKAA